MTNKYDETRYEKMSIIDMVQDICETKCELWYDYHSNTKDPDEADEKMECICCDCPINELGNKIQEVLYINRQIEKLVGEKL